ncbi:MAG: M48 family metalloprotease [Pseudomonadota bacterium]
MRLRLCGALVLFVLAASCAVNPVTGDRDLVLMSEQQEIALGASQHPKILQQYPLYDDPALQAYVNDVGQAIARISHRSTLPFTFSVVDSADINAFALPGGYIYITRGIMAYLNSEAELAGVLGHEVGHVTARHGVRQQSTQGVTGILSAVLAASTDGAYNDLISAGSQALVSGYGRSHELEADRLGAEYLANTGRNPERMIDVVRVLKDQELFDRELAAAEGREPRRYHGLFATHPDNDTRLQEVVRAANRFVAGATDDGRQRYLDMIDGMVFGESEAEGIIRGNAFYHLPLDLTVRAPDNWRIQNSPTKVIFARADQSAYMELTVTSVDTGTRPEDVQQRLLGREVAGRTRSARGMRGVESNVDLPNTPWGKPGPALMTTWVRDTQAFTFLAAAQSPAQLQAVTPEIRSVADSLDRLDDGGRRLAKARRLSVVRVGGADNFETLASRSALGDFAVQRLRLINGRYPDGQARAGQTIKVVR